MSREGKTRFVLGIVDLSMATLFIILIITSKGGLENNTPIAGMAWFLFISGGLSVLSKKNRQFGWASAVFHFFSFIYCMSQSVHALGYIYIALVTLSFSISVFVITERERTNKSSVEYLVNKCPFCGNENNFGNFCTECGTRLPTEKEYGRLQRFKVIGIIVAGFFLVGIISIRLNNKLSTVYKSNNMVSRTESSPEVKTDTTYKKVEQEEPVQISKQQVPNVQIAESIIYDDNGLIIKVTGAEYTDSSLNVFLLFINNSSLSLNCYAHSYAVNNAMIDNNYFSMGTKIASGKRASSTLKIDKDMLNLFNIKKIQSIQLNIWAYDNAKNMKDFETGQIEIRTSEYADTIERIVGKTVYEDDTTKIDYLLQSGNQIAYFFTNKSTEYAIYAMDNISVNDFTLSTGDYNMYDLINEEVLGNCQIILILNVDKDFMSRNSMESINTIEFNYIRKPLGDYGNEFTSQMIKTNCNE